MLAKSQKEFIEFFNDIEDPREDDKLLYPLPEILFLVFVSILSGAESWREIILFGNERIDLLKNYFKYENGLPTRSSLSRIFSLIDKKCIEHWLQNVAMRMVKHLLSNEQIAIDGKSLRGKNKMESSTQGAHVVNVFATRLGIVLSQTTVLNKGDELAAIIEVIDNSNLEGATVSIDAAGCQKLVTDKIIAKKGQYFLGLKKNHPKLYAAVEAIFNEESSTFDYYATTDTGHGRFETRICKSTNNIEHIKVQYPEWQGLKSICMVKSTRTIGKETVTHIRYFLSSQEANAAKQLGYARNHWGIENNLHWTLDVIFKEDDSIFRKNNAAENISAVRKMVINVIKQYKNKSGSKDGIGIIRKSAGWNNNVLVEILDSWLHT